jgi:hypothetical protein
VLRSIGAVVLGYLVFGLSAAVLFPLTGRDPAATGAAEVTERTEKSQQEEGRKRGDHIGHTDRRLADRATRG